MNLHERYWKTPKEARPRPKIDECIPRRLYHVACRNLVYAVYDGNQGFLGVRAKFGSRYLFTEFHWDQGEPFGTVHTAVDTGIDLPEHIELREIAEAGESVYATYTPLLEWLIEQEIRLDGPIDSVDGDGESGRTI